MTKKGVLRDYQIADLTYYIANPKCLNLSCPGVGKTPSVCVWFQYLWDHKQTRGVWVQPKSLLEKNRRELLLFTDFEPEDIVIVDGTAAQVKKQLASGAKVFLMGFARWRISSTDLPADVKAMAVDEAHVGFKKSSSATTQALFDAFRSKRMEYFLPMTGTLISGDLSSAYPLIHVIEPRYYLSYNDFLYQHAVKDLDDKIIGWHNHGKLRAILGAHAIRRTFKDVYGEQEIVHITEMASLSPKQEQLYRTFEKEALLELEKFFVDGTEPGVAFIRARQILEHPNHFPDLTEPGKFVDLMKGELPGKLSLLENHIEDHLRTGDPFLIFSPMRPQQTAISELLTKYGVKHALMNGETSGKDRNQIDLDYQAGKLQAIVASPAVASFGYNWQTCGDRETSHVIFPTPDYLDSTIVQAIQRAVRGVRQTPLRVTFFHYPDTMDERIFYISYKKSVDAHLVDPNRPVLDFGGMFGKTSLN